MGLSIPEAFTAATLGGAYALRIHDTHGSLEVGKRATCRSSMLRTIATWSTSGGSTMTGPW